MEGLVFSSGRTKKDRLYTVNLGGLRTRRPTLKEQAMGYALLVVAVFLTGQGQQFSAKYPTMEECQAKLAAIATQLAEHNSKAVPPEYVAMYAAACAEIKAGPRGTDA